MLGFLGRADVPTEINVDERRRSRTPAGSPATEMRAEAEDGSLVLPGGVSISRSLVEHWYGGPLPGSLVTSLAANCTRVPQQRLTGAPVSPDARGNRQTSARERGELRP